MEKRVPQDRSLKAFRLAREFCREPGISVDGIIEKIQAEEPGIDRETACMAADLAVRERTERIKDGDKETGYLFLMWIIWPIIALISGRWDFLWMLIPATVVVWLFQRSKAD